MIGTNDNRKGLSLANTVGEATIPNQALQVFFDNFANMWFGIVMLEVYLARY